MAVKVAIVGRPNVGKSTLFNRLVGKRLALVDDRPGVTRDRRYAEGQLGDLALTLIDTAGYEDVTDESLEARMRAQTEAAIEDADLILFMVDAREGVTPLDRIFADRLRKIDTPVVLLANKSESRESGGGVGEAYSLGFGEPVAISAEHGEGMADLYAAVVSAIGDMEAEAAEEADKPIRIAVIGRPNAGKSTLINRLLGEDRLLTGPEAGITRDSISVDWSWEGRAIRLVDTAGLRRKARVQEKLEKLSVADTLRAITFAEVVILVMDRDNAFDTQDLQLADLVEREGRALVYAIAKWDLEDEPQARLTALKAEAERTLPQLKGAPFVALSAFSGRGVERLMPAVIQAHDTWSAKVKTRDLNDWLAMAVQRHPPPAVDGKRVKPKYVAQTKARPPTFVMFASRAAAMPDHYKRYLVNGIRESFDLWGTPIRLTVKAGANPYAEGGEKAGLVRARAARPVYPVAKKVKAPKEEKAPGLPGKALQAQNAARAEAAAKPKPAPKVRVKPLAGLKASASKKAGTSAVLGKRARGGARQVSRSGRVRTGAPKGKR